MSGMNCDDNIHVASVPCGQIFHNVFLQVGHTGHSVHMRAHSFELLGTRCQFQFSLDGPVALYRGASSLVFRMVTLWMVCNVDSFPNASISMAF